VVFDIDGGLADMSPVTDRLGPKPWRQEARQEFFAGAGDAAVIEAGRELVAAVAALGFTTLYSTTRPDFTTRATRHWLSDYDFPPGPVFSRPNKSADSARPGDQAAPLLDHRGSDPPRVSRRVRRRRY
jgi:hypothetical protein